MLYPDSKIQPQSTSLVFIDAHLDNYQFLATGVVKDVEVIILDSTENGIDKITETLQKKINTRSKIEAIHIFSHGSPGSLQLGNTFLNLDNLISAKQQIQQWKTALTKTANILLYGCNLAANIGGEFVHKLGQILGVNIAASVDLTGSKLLGGNWNLGFTTGKIVAENPLQPEVMESYNSVFPTIEVTNNNDDGAGSLRQVIADANPGDTIVFASNLANQTITLNSSQLDINKDLIIDGAIDGVDGLGITISGNNARRVLETSSQTNVTIRNLTIANGRTTESGFTGNGGGIRTGPESTLTVENSTFENNVTSGEGGGAIWVGNRTNTTIINTKFDSNDATAGRSQKGGGAITTNGFAVLTIENSEFTNNKGINGGAIHGVATALTVENSTFINNDSTAGAEIPSSFSSPRGYGGAIYTDGVSASFDGDNGTIAIRNSHFEDNKGAGAGGAAFLFLYPGDDVVIENTNVINNSVIENAIDISQGGGIRLGTGRSSIGRTSPARFTISNSTFAGNTSEIEGGGLWIDRKLDLTRVEIVNSTFSENRAESASGTVGRGGAITAYAPTNITNTTITNNFAGQLAGAIYTNPSQGFTPDIRVRNTIFDRNTVSNVNSTSQQTNIQLIDQGGNLQFPAVDSNNAEELVTANIAIGDPNLADLQEVDGFLVHPLEDGSAAIDAGVNTDAPTTDQLGNNRPVDGDNNGSSITDIGAVEFLPTPTTGDCITGDNSDNLIDGTSDDDCIHGFGGNDTLKGAAGDDTINGGDGFDTLGGGAGNDQLNGDAGNDSLTGWIGDDIIDGGDGFDTLQGGDGFDTLQGGGDADTLKGGTGNDLLNGDSGDDFIQGQAGDDQLNGGDGQDTVGGGKGNDIVNGNAGNDSLTGWRGDDILTGGTGNDIVKGGDGLDLLNGEQGTDTLTGGSNSDRFIFDIGSQFNLANMGSDIIKDFNSAELDKIVLDKTTFTSLASVVGNDFSVAGEFAVVDSDAAVATSSAKVVYNSANGQLFYNPNGATSGFGDGGLFATLENQANLQAEDFILIAL